MKREKVQLRLTCQCPQYLLRGARRGSLLLVPQTRCGHRGPHKISWDVTGLGLGEHTMVLPSSPSDNRLSFRCQWFPLCLR